MRRILIVVDMQNDFIDGALGTAEAVAIVPKVKAKINEYKAAEDVLIFTQDTHSEHYLETQEGGMLPVPHCIQNTQGWEITKQLETADASVISKPTFGSVELAQLITDHYPCSEIELVGLCTDICVISNALLLKAFMPEMKLTVDAACCAGVTPQSHRNALEAMKMCQIHVIND